MSVGSAQYPNGFADIFGGKMFNTVDYSGPTSYNNTGTPATSGDKISHRMFGFENTIETFVGQSIDQSGTYYAIGQPLNNGVTSWKLRWFTTAGVEVANGVNLAAFTVKLAAIGF
jgi:hypothetical protein